MTRLRGRAGAGGAAMVALALAAVGCGGSSAHSGSAVGGFKGLPPVAIVLRSSAFNSGQPIPRVYTCDGRGTSPPLRWSGVQSGSRELVLFIRDLDAPGGNFVHWAVAAIAPQTDSVAAGQPPPGAVQGTNSAGTVGYTPPCPPRGDRPHRYSITLLALARHTALRSGFDPARLSGTGLASGTLVGTYARR